MSTKDFLLLGAITSLVFAWSEGFSPYTVKDYTFRSYPYTKINSEDWLGCTLACSQDSSCLSYDFQYLREAEGICGLYDCGLQNQRSVSKELIYSHGVVLQQLRPATVRVFLCVECLFINYRNDYY